MRVGLLVASIGNFGQKGFYNAQEIGLAKELDKLVDEIIIYKLVAEDQKYTEEKVGGCSHTTLKMIPSKSFGINGLIDVDVLDKTLDAIVFFSDTQICVPRVYKWSRKNNVKLFPYIGVLESHSTSKLKKAIMDSLFKRNLAVYKKCHCFVKTPTVEQKLRSMGVDDITVTPVGLDLSLLNQNYEEADKNELKLKYGFKQDDKVILFIGRLIEEKQPLKMVEIFSQLYKQDSSYRLLMVGTGPLREAVDEKIKNADLDDSVIQIEKIPNSDIWELYRFADCFVNLNQQEIFGMAILEAMYYGCKVVACHAPGPDFIIEDGVSGYLVSNEEEACGRIRNRADVGLSAKKRILTQFTWRNTAEKIYTVISAEREVKKMIKVGLVGHLMYDSGDKAVNGQAIKTRNICTMLQRRYGEENVLTLDTNYFRKSLFCKYKRLIKIASTVNTVVILPTANGLKLIMPVLSRMKKHYHFQILYSVIGGWLPEFLKSSDRMLKYMEEIDVIYVETRMLADQLAELGLSNVEVMPNFSMRLERAEEPTSMTKSEKPYKLCTFSRVTKKKGIGEAVECVRRINGIKGSGYCSLDIYGPLDEEYKDEFDTLTAGQTDIKYCGKLDGDSIILTLAKYDLMLFPTYYPGEGMPGAVIEAYAAKLPVVASDWHSNAEVIKDGVTGKIYKLGEMDELIEATVEVLENQTNLKTLSDNCYVESRKYLPNAVMQQMYNKIEEPTTV